MKHSKIHSSLKLVFGILRDMTNEGEIAVRSNKDHYISKSMKQFIQFTKNYMEQIKE